MIKQIVLNINSCLNGSKSTALLSGFAYLAEGFLQGRILPISHMSRVELALLPAFTFTGCPVAAYETSSGGNPWALTGGSYSAERTLHGPTFLAGSKIISVSEGDKIRMDLNLSVEGEVPNLGEISKPFQEKIIQIGKGHFVGEFNVEFRTKDGELVNCKTKTQYRLNVQGNFPEVLRNIVIFTGPLPEDPNGMRQIEQISLYTDPNQANHDLMQRIAASQALN